jgi:hypothetical protein
MTIQDRCRREANKGPISEKKGYSGAKDTDADHKPPLNGTLPMFFGNFQLTTVKNNFTEMGTYVPEKDV